MSQVFSHCQNKSTRSECQFLRRENATPLMSSVLTTSLSSHPLDVNVHHFHVRISIKCMLIFSAVHILYFTPAVKPNPRCF